MFLIRKIYIRIKALANFRLLRLQPNKVKKIIGKENDLFNSERDIPKIIWLYWDSCETNHLVDLCISEIKFYLKDYEIILLNKANVKDYVQNIDSIFNKNLKPAIVADYIRLYLIKKYGGVWMDASVLLTQDFNWIKKDLKTGVFLFYSDDCTNNLDKPIVENWFIMAEKENKFIRDWFDEFNRCIFSNNPYEFYKKFENNSLIQNIPNTDYLMCYISAAKVLDSGDYNITCINSGSVGHFYNYRCYSDGWVVALFTFLISKKNIYIPELIKYTKDTREPTNIYIKNKTLKSDSFMGGIVKRFF